MLLYEQNSIVEEINELVTIHGKDRSALLPILQAIQMKYNCISDFAQQEIARKLSISPVEVYSVISFYSFLSPEAEGRNKVQVCTTISCELAGRSHVVRAIERELNVKFGETTKDRRITLEYTNCLGMCDQGPALVVNDDVYTRMTPEKAIEIISELR